MPQYLLFDTKNRTFQVDIPENGTLNRGYTKDGFSWVEVLTHDRKIEFAHTDIEIIVRVGASVEVAHGPTVAAGTPTYDQVEVPQPVWDPEAAAQEYQANYPHRGLDQVEVPL